jgi:hypothetical protein
MKIRTQNVTWIKEQLDKISPHLCGDRLKNKKQQITLKSLTYTNSPPPPPQKKKEKRNSRPDRGKQLNRLNENSNTNLLYKFSSYNIIVHIV